MEKIKKEVKTYREEVLEKELLAKEKLRIETELKTASIKSLGTFRGIHAKVKQVIMDEYMKGPWKVESSKGRTGGVRLLKVADSRLIELLDSFDGFQGKGWTAEGFFGFRIRREHQETNLDSVGNEYYVSISKDGQMLINNIYDYDDIKFLREFGMEFDIGVLSRAIRNHREKIEKLQHEIDVWTLKKVKFL